MGNRQRAAGALSPALIILIVAGGLLIAALTNEGPGQEPTLADIATDLTPEVARGVEDVRGLAFDSIPEPQVVTAADLSELNATELSRPGVRERLLAEETVAKLLGLIEFDDDVLGIAEESGELAAAAYDPRTDELYVVSDAVGVSPELTEFVLAHELNHALEDQQFDLTDALGTGDRDLAETALVEGTATVTMIRYARRFQNSLALALAAGGVDPGTEGIPPFIVRQLLFAYTGGARFVRALYEETGSWAIVDNALERDPPVSSEQIVHPRKYLLNEDPLKFAFAYSAIAGDESDPPRTGTLGEFVTREMLGGGAAAARAAAGWSGDSWQLSEDPVASRACDEEETCREAFALRIEWAWDSRRDALEFAAALPALRDRLGARRVGPRWILPGQTATFSLRGTVTSLTFTPR